MEDEELLLNKPVDPPKNSADDVFNIIKRVQNKEGFRAGSNAKQALYDSSTGFGKSQYDEKLDPDTQIDFSNLTQSLEAYRSRQQPIIDKLGNSVARLNNIIPEAIGGMAAVLDFEDYYNSNDEVGNWLTNLMNEWKESSNEAFPIYRENRNTPLDVSDPSWWFENGSGLVNSIAGFAITGGAVSKSLQGLSKLAKISKLGSSINESIQIGGTALGLNQAEGILEATEVYNEVYEFQINELTRDGKTKEEVDAEARQKAADAASIAINTNRLNILLNLSSSSLFLKSNKATRQLLNKPLTGKNIGIAALEGVQESGEEIINYISSQRGKAIGKGGDYTAADVIDDISSPQAMEAALLGFLGGMGQTVITTEGVNRIKKTIDPETGEKLSIKDYNNLVYNRQKEIIESYNPEKFANIITSFQDQKILEKRLNSYIRKKDFDSADLVKNLILDNQAYTAFKNGTTEIFESYLEDIKLGEQKEGFVDNYQEVATKALNKVKKLENIYQLVENNVNSKELYLNRALALNFEEKFDEYDSKLSNITSELQIKSNRLNGIGDPESKDFSPILKKDLLYKEYKKYKKKSNNIKEDLIKLNEEFFSIATKKREKEVEDIMNDKSSTIEEELKKQSDLAQKRQEREEQEKLKEEIINNQKKQEAVVKESKKNQEDVIAEKANKTLQKNVGEKTTISDGKGNLIDVTISDILDDKILLIDDNGKQYKIPLDSKLVIKDKPKNDQVKNTNNYSTEGTDNNNIEPQVEETSQIVENQGSKIISTDESGKKFDFISESFMDYLLSPRDKRGETINFKINNKVKGINSNWDNALKGYDLLLKGQKPTKSQINFLIKHLPINAIVKDGIEAPIATLPSTEKSKEIFNSVDSILRTNIINALLDGISINDIKTTIQGQFGGELQIQEGVPENSVLELSYINNDISKVKLLMVNQDGDLQSSSGETIPFNKQGKGEIYLETKKANGNFYPLKLNISRVTSEQADILYDLYEERIENNLNKEFLISNLNEIIQNKIKDNLKEELKIINKSFKDISIKDITDILIWDGSSSPKSQVKVIGASLVYGENKIFKNNFSDKNKESFINWITSNKRRHIRFKKKANDTSSALDITDGKYLKYLLDNKILNTNAKVNEPLFSGKTNIFLNNEIEVIKEDSDIAESGDLFADLDQNIRKSDKNFVPLHKVNNTNEMDNVEKVRKESKVRKKLTPTERKKAAAEFRKRKKDC